MAANTCSSSTGTASGTDPNFIVAYKTNNPEAVYLMIKVTIGTMVSVSITFDIINDSISTTDKYRITALQGTDLVSDTMVIKSSGNYRIPVPIFASEKKIYANITPTTSGADGVIVADFLEA